MRERRTVHSSSWRRGSEKDESIVQFSTERASLAKVPPKGQRFPDREAVRERFRADADVPFSILSRTVDKLAGAFHNKIVLAPSAPPLLHFDAVRPLLSRCLGGCRNRSSREQPGNSR
jgi:hypothetical protein